MSAHKFRIGQMVTYRPDQRSQDVPPGGAYMNRPGFAGGSNS